MLQVRLCSCWELLSGVAES